MANNLVTTINELVDETEELPNSGVLEKGNLALKLQFLYLLERVFGEECLIKFDQSVKEHKSQSNSVNISDAAKDADFLNYLEQTDVSLSLFGVTKKFFVMPVYKKLITLKPESTNSDNVGAIARYGIYSPITMNVYSEDVLEKAAKFAKVYKKLSGKEAKIIQEYPSNDLVEKIITKEDSEYKKRLIEEIQFPPESNERAWLNAYERLLLVTLSPEFKIIRSSHWSNQNHDVVGSYSLYRTDNPPATIYRYETFVNDEKLRERILFYPKDVAITIRSNKSLLLQKIADFEAIYKEKTGGKTVKLILSV